MSKKKKQQQPNNNNNNKNILTGHKSVIIVNIPLYVNCM